jgi:hypothetical protein
METGLVLGSRDRQLGLSFRKLFAHTSGVELKVKGLLNTVSANCEVQGALSKVRDGIQGVAAVPGLQHLGECVQLTAVAMCMAVFELSACTLPQESHVCMGRHHLRQGFAMATRPQVCFGLLHIFI